MWRLLFFVVMPLWGEDVFVEEGDAGYLEQRLDDGAVLRDLSLRWRVRGAEKSWERLPGVSAGRVEAAGWAGDFRVGGARSGGAGVEGFQRVLLSARRDNGRGCHRGFASGFWCGSGVRAREE